MSKKFLPCQLKKKHAHSILILYLCKVLELRNLQLRHSFRKEKSRKRLKIRRKQQNGSLQTGVYRLYGGK